MGALGAVTGGAIEGYMARGLPGEELVVCEDALRRRRSVVVVTPENSPQEKIARGVLKAGSAETIDRAREMWVVAWSAGSREGTLRSEWRQFHG